MLVDIDGHGPIITFIGEEVPKGHLLVLSLLGWSWTVERDVSVILCAAETGMGMVIGSTSKVPRARMKNSLTHVCDGSNDAHLKEGQRSGVRPGNVRRWASTKKSGWKSVRP